MTPIRREGPRVGDLDGRTIADDGWFAVRDADDPADGSPEAIDTLLTGSVLLAAGTAPSMRAVGRRRSTTSWSPRILSSTTPHQ